MTVVKMVQKTAVKMVVKMVQKAKGTKGDSSEDGTKSKRYKKVCHKKTV